MWRSVACCAMRHGPIASDGIPENGDSSVELSSVVERRREKEGIDWQRFWSRSLLSVPSTCWAEERSLLPLPAPSAIPVLGPVEITHPLTLLPCTVQKKHLEHNTAASPLTDPSQPTKQPTHNHNNHQPTTNKKLTKPSPNQTDRRRLVRPAVLFALAAVVLQTALDLLTPSTSSTDNRPLLQRLLESRWSLMRRIPDEEYVGMLGERVLGVEVELGLVEERMGAVRREIERLEREGEGGRVEGQEGQREGKQ